MALRRSGRARGRAASARAANRDNAIVDWLVGAGDTLSQPFHGIFTPDGRKAQVGVNWGLAGVVYALVGGLIARMFRR